MALHLADHSSSSKLNVLLYGDSNTAGFVEKGDRLVPYGDSLRKCLAKSGVDCTVSWCGLCGFTAKAMVNQINEREIVRKNNIGGNGKGLMRCLIEKGGFDLVIIMAGTNDLLLGDTPLGALRHVCRLHDACHTQGIPTVAVAPPFAANNRARNKLASGLQDYANANPYVLDFADIEMLLPRSSETLLWDTDLLHMTALGSVAFGERLASHIITTIIDDIGHCSSDLDECPNVKNHSNAALEQRRIPPTLICVRLAPIHAFPSPRKVLRVC